MSTDRNSEGGPEAGFSIVETLVALFVFAVAGVALMQMQTQSVDTFSHVETRALASIVAENQLVDVMARRNAPTLGVREGETDLGGRSWRWRLEILSTDDPSTLRLKSQVFASDDGKPAADVSAYMNTGGVS